MIMDNNLTNSDLNKLVNPKRKLDFIYKLFNYDVVTHYNAFIGMNVKPGYSWIYGNQNNNSCGNIIQIGGFHNGCTLTGKQCVVKWNDWAQTVDIYRIGEGYEYDLMIDKN